MLSFNIVVLCFRFCAEHARKAQLARQKSSRRHVPPPSAESFLLSLSHYSNIESGMLLIWHISSLCCLNSSESIGWFLMLSTWQWCHLLFCTPIFSRKTRKLNESWTVKKLQLQKRHVKDPTIPILCTDQNVRPGIWAAQEGRECVIRKRVDFSLVNITQIYQHGCLGCTETLYSPFLLTGDIATVQILPPLLYMFIEVFMVCKYAIIGFRGGSVIKFNAPNNTSLIFRLL